MIMVETILSYRLNSVRKRLKRFLREGFCTNKNDTYLNLESVRRPFESSSLAKQKNSQNIQTMSIFTPCFMTTTDLLGARRSYGQ